MQNLTAQQLLAKTTGCEALVIDYPSCFLVERDMWQEPDKSEIHDRRDPITARGCECPRHRFQTSQVLPFQTKMQSWIFQVETGPASGAMWTPGLYIAELMHFQTKT